MIRKFFSALFGHISWQAPTWLKQITKSILLHPKAFGSSVVCLILFLTLSIYSYFNYLNTPKSEQVIAQITPPKITPNEAELVPYPLEIEFGIPANGELSTRAVAPLNLVGQVISSGIQLSPAMPGTWIWDNDHQLVFTPSKDWPAGQTYQIKFDKAVFTKSARMAAWSAKFSTLPFEAVISQFKFHQDPTNPQLRQVVATIDFGYPVDTQSLEDHIQLAYEGSTLLDNQSVKYTLKFDKHQRSAYLLSEALSLPDHQKYLELRLTKGIKALTGPGKTKDSISASVLIPDAANYFKVSHANAAIARNLQDRPEQVLAIETTIGVQQSVLDKALKVYLLPKDLPGSKGQAAIKNYAWQHVSEITPTILSLSTPLDLTGIPAPHDFSALHSYRFNTETPAYLYVKIDKGILGFGGFKLTHDYEAIISAPPYPQEITLLHKGALLALGTEEKLSVLVRGLNAVKFDIARVLPDDVNHLVTQTSGDFSNPYFIDPNFNQNNISQIFSEVQHFDASDLAKAQYTALNLKKYISQQANNGGPQGLFLLRAQGWDDEHQMPLEAVAKRLILITDLGLIVKDNNDGTHDVFVQSINNGTPVNQAEVAILGKNGIALMTHKTDATGHASFPNLQDFIDDKEPTVYLVKLGNDVSFIPYNHSDRQLNYSKFDIGGITTSSENQAALTAYIFSDRGIYRPGETAHIAMIVKQPFVFPQPAGLPLEVTVIDSRGVTIKDQKLSLNESGFLTIDLPTNQTSPTGQYFINLFIVKDNHPSNQIGSTSINIAEFLPDRLRINAAFSPKPAAGWISPTDLMLNVDLWNLYGTPAINHRVLGRVYLAPHAVKFKQYPDYTFTDPLLNKKSPPKIFQETLGEVHTNEQGQAILDLKLEKFDKATYELSVLAEGFEAESGRSVSTQVQALVSPLSYLVGYKADGDLAYINQAGTRRIDFIAINPDLAKQALTQLKLKISRLQPISTLVKHDDGTYQYQSVIQTTEISSEDFAIAPSGNTYLLPSKDIGDYLLTLTDSQGLELSQLKFSIVGDGQQTLPKNAELNVKLNKTEYAPGEEIEMQVVSPYIGAGLISLERDKTHAFKWFKANALSSIHKINIPNHFQGDGYVNIAFVRDLNSPEIFMNPLSYAVLPFSVTHKEHDLNVNMTVAEQAKPGDILSISYQTDQPSQIIIFAVDDGILQVSRYSTPDPTAYFFQKHALQVDTMQIVDQILPKFMADRELSAIGGDAGENAINNDLNPFKRKTDAPVVYWSGILNADTNTKQVSYQIPDYFNGSLRIMAVAVAPQAVGATSKTTEVKGDFIINPNLPTFASPGDEFDITASVANNIKNSGKDSSVTISLSTSDNLEILGDSVAKISITEGRETSLHFKVKAKNKLGPAELTFKASTHNKSSQVRSSLSVRPASPYITTLDSGYTNHNLRLTANRVLYPNYRKVLVAASPSPLILLSGIQHYLDEYPYGCTEQLTSQAIPALVMLNQPWQKEKQPILRSKIEKIIQMLALRQMDSGAFNYWPDTGSEYSNDFATIYAMQFLTEAKAAGFSVPDSMFFSGISYLKELVTHPINHIDDARWQAYAIYVLTRNEIVTTSYLTHLQLALEQNSHIKWQQDITAVYLATSYQLMKSYADAEKLLGKYKPITKPEIGDFYNSNIANAQYLFLVAKHFPDKLQTIRQDQWMSLVDSINKNMISTILLSYTTLALSVYDEYFPADQSTSLSINQILPNGKSHILSVAHSLFQQVDLPLGSKEIDLSTNSKQPYFYQLTQSGFDEIAEKPSNQGIEVYREYQSANENQLTQAEIGDDIIVCIRLRSTDNLYHNNIAIVDLLPGGFEVIRDSINIKNMDYVDIREDRVLIFGSIGPESKEFMYRLKATNQGLYKVSPIYATSMYQPVIKSIGTGTTILVGGKNN